MVIEIPVNDRFASVGQSNPHLCGFGNDIGSADEVIPISGPSVHDEPPFFFGNSHVSGLEIAY